MHRYAAKWIVILALIVSVGGHWGILQVSAWVGMTVSFCKTTDISTALVKTFNGKNPCKLCKFVKEGQKSERSANAKLDVKKIDFFTSPVSEFVFSVRAPDIFKDVESAVARVETPPTPPPLLA